MLIPHKILNLGRLTTYMILSPLQPRLFLHIYQNLLNLISSKSILFDLFHLQKANNHEIFKFYTNNFTFQT